MQTQELQKTDSQTIAIPSDVSVGALESALAGDLKRLPSDERLKFYAKLCEFTGLNPLAKPFDWLEFQGKLVLYANKGCAEQLRKIHGVSLDVIERKMEFGCLIVRVKATTPDGRHDEALAALPFNERSAADAAMAMMKCETKAKRRVTFSICGLSLLAKRDDDVEITAGAPTAPTSVVGETAHDRAEKLNAALTEGEKEKAVEVVSEAQTAAPVEVQIHTEPEPPLPTVAPSEPAATLPAGEDEKLRAFEAVLAEHPDSVAFLIHSHKLTKGAGLETVPADYRDKVVLKRSQFLKMVAAWVKGGKK